MQPMFFQFKALKYQSYEQTFAVYVPTLLILWETVGPGLTFSGRNSPNDQIHDAVVEHLLVGVVVGDLLLLFLNLLHQLLGLDPSACCEEGWSIILVLAEQRLTCALLLVMM